MDIIDIDVELNNEIVEVTIEPNLTTININTLTGGLVDSVNGEIGDVILNLQDVTDEGATTTHDIEANSFIKSGGLSSEFLKADGSVDSNTYAEGTHTHDISDVTNLQNELDDKADVIHTHVKSDITDFAHTHPISEIDNLQSELNGKASVNHTHIINDVTGLQTALNGKANTIHTHTISDVTGLQNELDSFDLQKVLDNGNVAGKAIDLNSPDYPDGLVLINNTATDSDDDGVLNVGVGIDSRGSTGGYFYGDFGRVIEGGGIGVSANSDYGTGLRAFSTNGKALQTFGNGTVQAELNNGATSKGLVINSGASSTGDVITHDKNGVINYKVTQSGNVTANQFIKSAGTSSQFLKADGSVDSNTYAQSTHTHTKSQITDFAHTHPISEVTNLQTELNNKSNVNHTHVISDVTNLQTELDSKQNNLPQDQIDALDNSSNPSATNPFLTASQIVGGLPTGQIPSGYVSRLTPFVISSPTFVDIPNLSTSITLSSPVKGYSLFSFECDSTGADATIELRIILNGETSDAIFIDFSKDATANGSINFRTTNDIPIGTHTIKAQVRKVNGNKIPSINKGFLFGLGLQAPKGEDGQGVDAGGLTGQVLFKNSNNSYDTSWRNLVKSDITDLINPMTVLASSPQIVDKTWFGTQAQYTALGVYDNTVTYNII